MCRHSLSVFGWGRLVAMVYNRYKSTHITYNSIFGVLSPMKSKLYSSCTGVHVRLFCTLYSVHAHWRTRTSVLYVVQCTHTGIHVRLLCMLYNVHTHWRTRTSVLYVVQYTQTQWRTRTSVSCSVTDNAIITLQWCTSSSVSGKTVHVGANRAEYVVLGRFHAGRVALCQAVHASSNVKWDRSILSEAGWGMLSMLAGTPCTKHASEVTEWHAAKFIVYYSVYKWCLSFLISTAA